MYYYTHTHTQAVSIDNKKSGATLILNSQIFTFIESYDFFVFVF